MTRLYVFEYKLIEKFWEILILRILYFNEVFKKVLNSLNMGKKAFNKAEKMQKRKKFKKLKS